MEATKGARSRARDSGSGDAPAGFGRHVWGPKLSFQGIIKANRSSARPKNSAQPGRKFFLLAVNVRVQLRPGPIWARLH